MARPTAVHFPKDDVKPTLIAFTQTMKLVDNPNAVTGVRSSPRGPALGPPRHQDGDAARPVLGKQEAYEKGCHEAWMVEHGHVTEGTSSNATS